MSPLQRSMRRATSRPRARRLLLAVLLAACEPASAPTASRAPEESAAAPDWSRAFRHRVRHDAARRALVVELELEPGFHAYAAGETVGRPLRLELDPASPVRLSGEVTYPAGRERMLPIGRSVIVEGKAEIVAPLAASPPGAAISGRLHYQVCSDEACDRPRSAPFTLTTSGAPG
jgi:hypothetical protein